MRRQAKNYIVFPLDVSTVEEAEGFVRMLSGRVGMFKVGLELFIAGGARIMETIRAQRSAKIFLDLKLHDIPVTVGRAMEQISAWKAAYATVHCSESRAMLEAAVKAAGRRTGVLGVTVLTSVSGKDLQAAGFDPAYVSNPEALVIKRAQMAYDAGCAGVVCSGREAAAIKERFGAGFVTMVPGIRPGWAVDADDQKRIVTPAEAIKNGADYLVIGRPIRDAGDPVDAAGMIEAEIEEALV
ncbi:MAG: orotidine-5'-phosphate decarboxylase [Desulfobacteraceae bacterium]|nr:orotidine-5'-phosphate decarboxylase [Desulfobacteraceae bacterium]MCF8095892.1 orotidine-5'-phosphate decarboxylase [Desulfobacteraceae bacterium]